MEITKEHIEALEAFFYKASRVANALYNVGQKTEERERCFQIIEEFDSAKHEAWLLLGGMRNSLVDPEALRAWEAAGSPRPRELWFSAYLTGKGGKQ